MKATQVDTRQALDWVWVVLTGLAAMTSGFLAGVSRVGVEEPGARDLAVRVLGVPVDIGAVPTWPWFVLTPLLMTCTFLLSERAHARARQRRLDEDR